jgi:hypothetical protein
MPGPLRGPSWRIMTTSPSRIFFARIAFIAASSPSNTRAGPVCFHISLGTAALFTTAPSGARVPDRIFSPPSWFIGFSRVLITSSFRICAAFAIWRIFVTLFLCLAQFPAPFFIFQRVFRWGHPYTKLHLFNIKHYLTAYIHPSAQGNADRNAWRGLCRQCGRIWNLREPGTVT